jgi:hypothetical protein
MYCIRPCSTRDDQPKQLEHWLHAIQKHTAPIHIILKENKGKVEWHCSTKITPFLQAATTQESQVKLIKCPFYVQQNKGPLLPIKRPSEFEDIVHKTRIIPLSSLIDTLAQCKEARIQFSIKAVKDSKRRRVLRKAKSPRFDITRRFDQWESKAWLKWRLRRLIGPLLRKSRELTRTQEEQTTTRHEREDPRQAMLDKLSRPLFQVEISMSLPFKTYIHSFNLPYLNQLSIKKRPSKNLLSAEELASLLSIPNAHPHLLQEASAHLPNPLKNPLGFNIADSARHSYLIGKTGMGKSTLMLQLFEQKLMNGECVILMDPHGDLVDSALERIPKYRENDVIYLDPSQSENPLSLNPLSLNKEESAHLRTSALIELFKALSQGSWGPRLEYILRNSLLTLCQAPNTRLLDLPRLLNDVHYAKRLLSQLKDLELQRFWEEEFFKLEPRIRHEHCAPILNKVGPLLTHPLLRNIIGQPKNKIALTQWYDQNKIILIKLSKGALGEDLSRCLGIMLIAQIQSSLLTRQSTNLRNPVNLFIDEFQNLCTQNLIGMLSESRKYGLALTLANQYLSQIPEDIQDAVLGNVSNLFLFQTSYQDAQQLAPGLGLNEFDLTQIEAFQCYIKRLHETKAQPLFRWKVDKPKARACMTLTKKHWLPYTRPRELVEEKLFIRYNKSNSTYKK